MASIPKNSWHQLVQELRRSEPQAMRAWLLDLEVPSLHHGILTLSVRNAAQLRHVEQFRTEIGRCAQSVLGLLTTVEPRLEEHDDGAELLIHSPDEPQLREDFTLDKFLVGHENRMAHAALLKFLQDDDCPWKLLYLHGPAGAGKTHLLQAACRHWGSAGGASLYAPAMRFIGEFTECFELAEPGAFRGRYTSPDLLALDDLEYFSGKPRSQGELFHILNSRLGSNRRLLLTADRPPDAIAELEERIVSRLSAGLVMAMDSPSPEMRLQILEQQNLHGCFQYSQAMLNRIAELCPGDRLDQILRRLNVLAQKQGGAATIDLVEDLFRRSRVEPLGQLDDIEAFPTMVGSDVGKCEKAC